jgi:hypothetical protein
MTKPDNIPQDVWSAAEDAFDTLLCNDIRASGTSEQFRIDSITPVARAILAERERCAKMADAERDRHWLNYQNGGQNRDLFYTTAAENVAAAIRNGGA